MAGRDGRGKAVRAFKNRLFFKVRNGIRSIILRMLAYKQKIQALPLLIAKRIKILLS